MMLEDQIEIQDLLALGDVVPSSRMTCSLRRC